ncbi:formyl transferase [Thalassotalea sp. HSM 43]|uniref:formyl transferase n=1 Tax=Thalassotalea sp. HSM 43 TaxID=2552945 RepID=UPI00107FDE2F|nr:formyl transferase [Thalassotalea sp. HSM 43]QBY04897.1 formyl transferase [Thalassotalea sp. HSM 43]
MNIVFVANKDLAANVCLNKILPSLAQQHRLNLYLSSAVGKRTQQHPDALQNLKQFEQHWDDLVPVQTTPSKQPEAHSKYVSFEQLTPYLQSPIELVNNINHDESLAKLNKLAPDLIVSIRYGCIIKPPAIRAASKGVINLHSGILPDYRGVMATFWAMLNDESEIGTTLHFISDGNIDTGNVIKISKQARDPQACYLSQVLSLYQQGSQDILQAINAINNEETISALPQQGQGNYFSFPSQEDLQRFDDAGMCLIDKDAYNRFIKQHY